jgi:putative copper resistance protein D
LPTLAALDDPKRGRDAAIAVARFSSAGHLAVALVILSGVINTLLVLGRWPTNWSSPYQAMLGVKIALVATMIALAIVNRHRFLSRMAAHRPDVVRAVRRGTIAELVLGLCAIGLVSVFGMLEPA